MYQSIFTAVCLFCLSLSFHPVIVVAAEPVDSIVVSATRSASDVKNTPLAISVITAEEIAHSGAVHLVDVLRSNGGLTISDLFGDGTDASVALRGFSATAQQNTLILIDGRRLNNADNGLPDLNTVAISSIDHIEIVKGSLGSLYGDKAVGGVINIITRQPQALDYGVEAGYGSDDNRSLHANVENSHANGIRYRLSAERRLQDNYRDNNALRLTDVFSTASFTHEQGELFVELQAQDENIEVPGPLFADQLRADRRQALNPEDYIGTDTWSGRAGLRQQLTDQLEVLAEYTNRRSDTSGQLSSSGIPTLFDSKRHHIEYTPRLNLDLPMPAGKGLLTVGADLFSTDYLIHSDFGLTDDTQTQQSVYARAVLPLIEQLTGTVGTRYGKVENEILVDTLAFGRSLPSGTQLDDNEHAWELGLSYQLTSEWRVTGRLDRNFRFVTADEYSAVADNNFFTRLFAFGQTVPLPSTQTGLTHELGLHWQNQTAMLGVQLYQLDINDEIVFDPLLFLNTNTGDTRRRGIELEGRVILTDNLDLSANWNMTDAEFVSGPFTGENLTFLARHTGSVRTSYRFTEALRGYLELVGTSDRVLGGDFANQFDRLPGYVVSNLNLSWQLSPFTVALRVNNLTDKHYSDSANTGFDFRKPFPSPEVETYFPSPGTNFRLTVKYDFQ